MQISPGSSSFTSFFGTSRGATSLPKPGTGPAGKPAARLLVEVDPPRDRLIGRAGLSIAQGLGCLPRWKNPHKTPASPPSVEAVAVPAAAAWAPPARDPAYWTFQGASSPNPPPLPERRVECLPAAQVVPEPVDDDDDTVEVLLLRGNTPRVFVPPGPQRPQPQPLRLLEEAAMQPVTEVAVDLVLGRHDTVTVTPGPQRPAPQPVIGGGQAPDVGATHSDSEAPVTLGPRRIRDPLADPAFDPRARSLVEAIKAIIRRDDSVKHAGREMHVKHGDIGKLLMSALRGKGGYAIDDAVVRDVLLLVARDSEIDDGMRMHLFQQVTRPRIGLTSCLGLRSLQAVAAQLRASQRSWKDVWAFGQTVSNLYNVHARLLRENAAALKYEIAAVEACGRDAGKDKRADSVRFALSVGARRSLNEIRSPAPARKS